jgi:hypothetical protein
MNPYWVRNHDRHKAPDISSEIGDCRMMLEKFSRNFGKGEDSEIHLRRKMEKKGFPSAVRLINIFPQIQGKLFTRVFNAIILAFNSDTGRNLTVGEVATAWAKEGKIPQLYLGKTGSRQLINVLIAEKYYLPSQDKHAG